MSEINYISLKKINQHLPEVREVIEEQVPGKQEIISQYTEKQFVEGEINVDGITLRLRTLPPFAVDDAIEFAVEESRNNSKRDRVLARRRLAYALISVNGKNISSKTLPAKSYHDILSLDGGVEQLQETIGEFVESNYKALMFHGLSDKMSEIFGVWEKTVYDRINDIGGDLAGVLKN